MVEKFRMREIDVCMKLRADRVRFVGFDARGSHSMSRTQCLILSQQKLLARNTTITEHSLTKPLKQASRARSPLRQLSPPTPRVCADRPRCAAPRPPRRNAVLADVLRLTVCTPPTGSDCCGRKRARPITRSPHNARR